MMFKGKVYLYKNVNGKEEKIEREFDNPQDFQSFTKEHQWGWSDVRFPRLGVGDWMNMHTYLENLIDKKLAFPSFVTGQDEGVVSLEKYEDELSKIEYQKQHKDEHVKSLNETLAKLKDYKKKFKKEGRDDMVAQLEEDIKKIDEELAKV